jgi:hypothetical protein
MGTCDIISMPPASTASPCPAMMACAPYATACSPEEQKRLIVAAEVSTGKPARSHARRPWLSP